MKSAHTSHRALPSSSSSDAGHLRHIATTSRKLIEALRPRATTLNIPSFPPPGVATEVKPRATFRIPEFPKAKLVALGLDGLVVDQISETYTTLALRSKEAFEENLQRTEQVYTQGNSPEPSRFQVLRHKLQDAYTLKLNKMLQYWLCEIYDRVATRVRELKRRTRKRPVASKGEGRVRATFNQKSVSTLEKFFEFNAFPSRAEKQRLADSTDMEYRQIDVWFQNRRNRTKKEGRETKKGDGPSLPVGLETHVERILSGNVLSASQRPSPPKHSAAHASKRSSQSVSQEQHTVPPTTTRPSQDARIASQARSVLDPTAPPHAYPTAYPPTCSYDPFPASSGGRHFALPWPRTAILHTKRDAVSVDVMEILPELAALKISDTSPPLEDDSVNIRSSDSASLEVPLLKTPQAVQNPSEVDISLKTEAIPRVVKASRQYIAESPSHPYPRSRPAPTQNSDLDQQSFGHTRKVGRHRDNHPALPAHDLGPHTPRPRCITSSPRSNQSPRSQEPRTPRLPSMAGLSHSEYLIQDDGERAASPLSLRSSNRWSPYPRPSSRSSSISSLSSDLGTFSSSDMSGSLLTPELSSTKLPLGGHLSPLAGCDLEAKNRPYFFDNLLASPIYPGLRLLHSLPGDSTGAPILVR